MLTTRPDLKEKSSLRQSDWAFPQDGRKPQTELKLNYLGRFYVRSPEPEVLTIDGVSAIASMRTELNPYFRRQPSAYRRGEGHLPFLSETVRSQRR